MPGYYIFDVHICSEVHTPTLNLLLTTLFTMNKVGAYALKKGTQMATKKFLNKEMDLNKDRKPGGEWVSTSIISVV